MNISFQFHSIFINILKTVLRSVVFNSACIALFGLIYFFVATDKMSFDQYFILSTKAQFLLPTPSDHLNVIEKLELKQEALMFNSQSIQKMEE